MYYIYEHQHRQDGEINVIPAVNRTTFSGALSYFHERCSKMVVNEQFTCVDVLLVDEYLAPVTNGHARIHDGRIDLN